MNEPTMVRTLGLDLSLTNTGAVTLEAWLDPQTLKLQKRVLDARTIKTTADPINCRRARIVRDKVGEVAQEFRPHLVLVEAYAFHVPSAQSTHTASLGEVGGLVKDYLQNALGRWHKEAGSNVLKKFCYGNGNLGSDSWMLAVFQRHGWEAKDQHQCMAFAAALLGAADLLLPVEMHLAKDLTFCGLDAPARESFLTWRNTGGTVATQATSRSRTAKAKKAGKG